MADLVENCCRLAGRFADRLSAVDGLAVLNDVVINQGVVAFEPPPGEDRAGFRDRVAAAIQSEGTCWAGGTTWRDIPALRLSVSNWRTTDADVDRQPTRSSRCIAAAVRAAERRGPLSLSYQMT